MVFPETTQIKNLFLLDLQFPACKDAGAHGGKKEGICQETKSTQRKADCRVEDKGN